MSDTVNLVHPKIYSRGFHFLLKFIPVVLIWSLILADISADFFVDRIYCRSRGFDYSEVQNTQNLHWNIFKIEYGSERPFYVCTHLVMFRPHKGVSFSSDDVAFGCSFKMSCCVPCAASPHCAVVNRKLKNVDLFCCLPRCAFPE